MRECQAADLRTLVTAVKVSEETVVLSASMRGAWSSGLVAWMVAFGPVIVVRVAHAGCG
jgi:hypothetical protein